jgi:hypothetical protein
MIFLDYPVSYIPCSLCTLCPCCYLFHIRGMTENVSGDGILHTYSYHAHLCRVLLKDACQIIYTGEDGIMNCTIGIPSFLEFCKGLSYRHTLLHKLAESIT